MQWTNYALLLALFPAFVGPGNAASFPEELAAVARQHECSPGVYVEGSPEPQHYYAYGYAAAREEKDSAVFWCEGDTDGMPRLVFMFKDPAYDTDGCPNVIVGPDTPGRLSIYKDTEATLDMYVHVDDETKSGPKGLRPTRNGVYSFFDGGAQLGIAISEYFYCHDGAWLKRRELQH